MRLKQYLEENYLQPKMISEKLGVTRTTVGSWMNGHSVPRPACAALIAYMTKGIVTAQDFHEHYIERHPVEAEG